MVILPVHMDDPITAAEQCRVAMRRFIEEQDFQVVVLDGHGNDPQVNRDVYTARGALTKLGFESVI